MCFQIFKTNTLRNAWLCVKRLEPTVPRLSRRVQLAPWLLICVQIIEPIVRSICLHLGYFLANIIIFWTHRVFLEYTFLAKLPLQLSFWIQLFLYFCGKKCLKHPSSKFLFSYLILHVTQGTSVKKLIWIKWNLF